jgi:hypothetical protein
MDMLTKPGEGGKRSAYKLQLAGWLAGRQICLFDSTERVVRGQIACYEVWGGR